MQAFPPTRGQVKDWTVIVVGHLRYNPYFGESADAPPRGDPSTCTSTMIRGDGYVLIVDPTLRVRSEDYYFDINRRTGLRPNDITHVFATHDHMDHHAGFGYFPRAHWLAASSVAVKLKDSKFIDGSRVKGVEGEFLPGVFAVPLPGHTDSTHGVAFVHAGKKVVVAGDGVMTRDHFRENTTMFQQDAALAARTIASLKESADLVVPGHDNVIVVR